MESRYPLGQNLLKDLWLSIKIIYLKQTGEKHKTMKWEEKHDTSRLILFSMRFLGNSCSTTFRVGRNSLVSGSHCSFMSLESAVPRSQAEGLLLLNCARLEGFHRLCATVGLSHWDLLPLNSASARPAHFHGLKLSFTPNRVTLSSHLKVHLYVWCISEQQMWSWGS